MKKEILLKLNNVSVDYGGVRALDGVDVEIDEGEIIALMGPNGAGKSTILKVMFGLVSKYSGDVLWHKNKINPIFYEMVKRGVSFAPQGRRVFSHLSVKENLEVGGFTVKNKKIIDQRIAHVLDLFPDLKKKLKTKAGVLSGGQQQMLAFARALMTDPKVLLLDEPTLGLAPKILKEVFGKIREINEKHKTAIIIVEHNVKSVLEIAHKGYILDKGKIVKEGLSSDILSGDIY